MIINYTSIVKSRFDAPYLGTLIAGYLCYGSCAGCFNQHIKSMEVLSIDADELLDSISADPFSQGIILGGMEWLDQSLDETLYLIEGAIKRNMKAMLYTRQTEDYLRNRYPQLFKYTGLYIKVGEYDESKKVYEYASYGVPLSTSNQYIIKVT